MCFMMNTLHLLSPSNLKNRICKYKQNNLIYNLYLEKKVVSPEKKYVSLHCRNCYRIHSGFF